MSISTLVKAPKTDEEWALSVEKRLRSLLNPQSMRIGDWVLNAVDEGLQLASPGSAPMLLNTLVNSAELDLQELERELSGTFLTKNALAKLMTGNPASTQFDLLSYIESLPTIGPLVQALTGIVGGTLSTLQTWATALFGSGPSLLASALSGALNTGVTIAGNAVSSLFNGGGVIASMLTGALNTGVTIAGNTVSSLFNGSGDLASMLTGALNTAVTISGNPISSLFGAGGVLASMLSGALNAAVTISGNPISSLFNGSGVVASMLTGALNTAVTIAGNPISTLFSSSGALASKLTGALNTAVTISGNPISALFNGSGVLASAITGALNTGVTIFGNPLSSLFSASGILASAITGALNAGVTIAGNPISALFNAGGVLGSAITGALNTAVTVAGVTVDTIRANAASALSDAADIGTAIENAAAGTLGSLGAVGAQVQSGFSGFLSALHAGLVGGNTVSPPTASQAQVADAAAALQQRLAIIGNGAEEQVDIEFNAYSNGAVPGIFSPLTQFGTAPSISGGVLTVTGSNLSWQYRYNAATTLTDFQKVTGIWPTFSPGSATTRVGLLFGRMGVSTSSHIDVEYEPSAHRFHVLAFASNALVIDVTFSDTFTPGAAYSLMCGDSVSGDAYRFSLLKDDVPLPLSSVITGDSSQPAGQLYYRDTSHSSVVGAAWRSGGLGMNIGNAAGTISMSSFRLQDTVTSDPSVLVPTAETTGSTTYSDLTTISDEVAVNIGPSGKALVTLNSWASLNTIGNVYLGFAMSGANTQAASDAYAATLSLQAGWTGTLSRVIVLSSLTPGLTIFKLKYRVNVGTGTFSNRGIGVVAL